MERVSESFAERGDCRWVSESYLVGSKFCERVSESYVRSSGGVLELAESETVLQVRFESGVWFRGGE